MILPTKHLSIHASLLGLGAGILQQMDRPKTVTSLWESFQPRHPAIPFHRFITALDFLYAINAIEYRESLLQRRES